MAKVIMSEGVKIDRQLAGRVLKVVDKGLCNGVGKPKPGQMCVEAAVCYAMGLEHGDEPPCVDASLRQVKITLNDLQWKSKKSRARGMRRLAIAQLGTHLNFDDVAFVNGLNSIRLKVAFPMALETLRPYCKSKKEKSLLEKAFKACELKKNGKSKLANILYELLRISDHLEDGRHTSLYYALSTVINGVEGYDEIESLSELFQNVKDYDACLAIFAEEIVQLLVRMKTPGSRWLDLTE